MVSRGLGWEPGRLALASCYLKWGHWTPSPGVPGEPLMWKVWTPFQSCCTGTHSSWDPLVISMFTEVCQAQLFLPCPIPSKCNLHPIPYITGNHCRQCSHEIQVNTAFLIKTNACNNNKQTNKQKPTTHTLLKWGTGRVLGLCCNDKY